MDDNDSIYASDSDEFMLDVEITAPGIEEILSDETNQNFPNSTMVDLPAPSDESMNFDGNQFGLDLLKHLDDDQFEKILFEHWKVFVPQCFRFHTPLTKGMFEQRAEQVLFQPLDVFLFGTINIEQSKQEIRSFNKRSTVCGHLFKSEEPTYFCRDCCVDSTCVLCTECFLQSEHRKHRYKMNVSAGGGYCDCGDKEAWKQHVHCNFHMPHEGKDETANDVLRRLPPELCQRARKLFEFLLNFSIRILCAEDYQTTPELLKGDCWDGDHKKFVTMLFNDEVHTYDQVISVLGRAIQCTKPEGHEFASLVDREGRAAILIGTAEQCREAQQKIRTRTNEIPLKCVVYPSSFISLQYFAQKIFTYLQEKISISDGFRQIFCESEMKFFDQTNLTFTDKILIGEKLLWKSARSDFHQIFINSFFMDAEWKKIFAISYMKNYSTIWMNFVKDHDEYVSFTDLSVQIFTVPTLARYLISTHNAFKTIVDSFLEYCQPKLDNGKLSFSRTTQVPVQNEFRRAQSILLDLKYLLGVVPEQFSIELRENFLNGFRSFLKFLSYMHGMDKSIRQTGQHVEFDPEWETAFNLVIKIQSVINSILDWCLRDHELLIRAYEIAGEFLGEIQQNTPISHLIKEKKNVSPFVPISINDFKVECFVYDVAKDPVTVHIPIVRIFVALHALFTDFDELKTIFDELCKRYKISPSFTYEEATRIQVLCAQHVAGLWRRNGYALSNQIYYYSNVKCRKELFDRDILALQVGASLTPPNNYLVHLLYKFSLLEWARSPENGHASETDSKIKEKIRIMEEFLHLLILIVNERFETGVGKITRGMKLRREVIHQLCISPMAHSELVRGLQDCGQLELGSSDLEQVLTNVADLKRTSSSKVNYELKSSLLSEYNPFYYHYTKADQCKSEEYVLKRRKLNEDYASNTLLIPVPPEFSSSFSEIVHLLDCDIFITLLRACFVRSIDVKAQLISEGILSEALHLTILAFYEQQRLPNFEFVRKLKAENFDQIFNQLASSSVSRMTNCKDLINHVIKLFAPFNRVDEKPDESMTTNSLFQDNDDSNSRMQKKRKDLAASKRARMIAQMTALQKNFMEQNIQLCPDIQDQSMHDDLSTSITPEPMCLEPKIQSCLGTYENEPTIAIKPTLTCIFCQENSEVKLNGEALVLSAYVQNSRVLSRNRSRRIENWDTFDPTFMSNDLHWGVHISSCGHAIHASCWTRYYNSIVSQDQRRLLRLRNSSNYDIDLSEFLCPLCQTLSNTVIPVLPPLRSLTRERKSAEMSFVEWIDGLLKALNGSIESRYEIETHEQQIFFNPCPLTTITKMMAERAATNFQLLFGFTGESKIQDFSDSIRERLVNFAGSVYRLGLNNDRSEDENERIPIILWASCAYTIQSIEQLLRVDGKSIFSALSFHQSELIQSLTKVAAVFGLLTDSDQLRKHCLKLLAVLLLPKSNVQNPSFTDIDLFHLLLSLCFTLPILFASRETSPSLSNIPTGNLNDLYLMRLITLVHSIQILSSPSFLYTNDTSQVDDHQFNSEAFEKLIEKIRKNSPPSSTNDHPLTTGQIREKLKQSLLPLLRCSSLFYHNLTGIPWPTESQFDEYSTISLYLGLPLDPADLFNIDDDSNLNELINSWILTTSNRKILVKYPTTINQLHSLPFEYIDLMNQVSQGAAPYKYARDELRSPCICLTCGEIVCRNSTPSPLPLTAAGIINSLFNIDHSMGPCNSHTQQCCGSIGLFLRVKECSLLLLNITTDRRNNKSRGTLLPAPYLDDYGETDQNLRRGNPLHFCDDRYRALHRRWISHSIPEDISRNMESHQASMYTQNWSLY